jgi:superfamily II DNA/RNA helicase
LELQVLIVVPTSLSLTTGRILSRVRRDLDLRNLKVLVLDEIDEVIARGFADSVREIMQLIPGKCQVGIFSSVMPQEVWEIAKRLHSPLHIMVKKDEISLEGIRQFYVNVEREEWYCNDTGDIDVLQEVGYTL